MTEFARPFVDGELGSRTRQQLETLLAACTVGAVYVSAFPDFGEFRKYIRNIAWETEVWLCDTPDHMIHFDGERFLGPRE